MCMIETKSYECGEPLDDGITKCPDALADGRNPFYCTNRDEKEVTYLCTLLASASNKEYEAYDNNNYEDNENEKEDGVKE
jgi:hypothetical protein